MPKTLIGMVSFGNLAFTKQSVKSIKDTVKNDYDIFLVIGKPGDSETGKYASEEGLKHIYHNENMGFPYSVNDIYDFAWKTCNYDYIVIMGNDVIAYPYSIDSLIKVADTTENEWICPVQYSVQDLVRDFPEHRKLFGDNFRFSNFESRCWESFTNFTDNINISDNGMSETHNLALYKKSFFDKLGYIDVNFFPCLVPETPVLTSKLTWVKLEDLNIGDELIGVEEYPKSSKKFRKYKKSIVEEKVYKKAECLKITLEDGREIICSKNHRWLSKYPTTKFYHWVETNKLKEGYRICSPFSINEYIKQDNSVHTIEKADTISLLSKLCHYDINQEHSDLIITKIEDVGMKDVIDIQTSTRTFIANGLVTHNCYYEDNDLVKRALLSDIKSCTVTNSVYFHFWSRTVNQETGGSNNKFFNLNHNFYITKWGGDFLQERYSLPFNGQRYRLYNETYLEPTIKINSRVAEKSIIDYWKYHVNK
jgi:GT2 family glycosyltransferase